MACFPNNMNNCCCARSSTEVRVYSNPIIPSSLNAFTSGTNTFASGAYISFAESPVETGVSLSHINGNDYINVLQPGSYSVLFTGSLFTGTTDNFQLGISVNNNIIPQSIISQTVNANTYENVSMQATFTVANTATIRVLNIGSEVDVSNPNILVTKL